MGGGGPAGSRGGREGAATARERRAVDALVTKSTQVLDAFMKEKVGQVQALANVVLGRDTLTTDHAVQAGWAAPFPRRKRPPAPCQVAKGAGQCPLGAAALPR